MKKRGKQFKKCDLLNPLTMFAVASYREQRDTWLPVKTSHELIKEGSATIDNYELMTLALEMGAVLAKAGHGDLTEYSAAFNGAYEGIKSMYDRAAQKKSEGYTGRFTYPANIIKHVDYMIDAHLWQLQNCTRQKILKAEEEVKASRRQWQNRMRKQQAAI